MSTFVSGLEAKGGDDWAEDVAGGLQIANGMDWQSESRQIFLFCDAPPHGSEWQDRGFGDNHPKSGFMTFDALDLLHKKSVNIRVIKLDKALDKMESTLCTNKASSSNKCYDYFDFNKSQMHFKERISCFFRESTSATLTQ